MVNIILISHGGLAAGLLNAMELIAGPQPGVLAVSLEEDDAIDGLRARIEAALNELDEGDGVLAMVDLFGASPFNVAAQLVESWPGLQVVTGVNLPMLLETVLQREGQDAAALANFASSVGRSGTKSLDEWIHQAG